MAEATRRGGRILKLFSVAETATRSEERKTFRELVEMARSLASEIDGILVYKVNRAARNMRDFAELEALESDYGIPIISVTEPMENTPAGRMQRRTLAVFATFQTEQQADDVRGGQRKRVENGLFVGVAPYGYRNLRRDGRGLVATDRAKAERVRMIFDLYAHRHLTLDGLRKHLKDSGVPYTDAQPDWTRSKLHHILTSRVYLGEVPYQGQWYPGVHEPLVTINLFDHVQALLGGRTYNHHELTYAGELITCGHCGHVITGERIIKKKTGREYVYYRCSKYLAEGHPRHRLTEADLDEQVLMLFARMRQPEDVREWFATTIRLIVRQSQESDRLRTDDLQRQLTRIATQRDRLLNLRLNEEIEQETFAMKDQELRDRQSRLELQRDAHGRDHDEKADEALTLFELSQNLHGKWLTADYTAKRRILDFICLNFRLDGASLVPTMRKPFDVLVEGLELAKSRGDRIRTCGLLLPKQALCQAELRPGGSGDCWEGAAGRQGVASDHLSSAANVTVWRSDAGGRGDAGGTSACRIAFIGYKCQSVAALLQPSSLALVRLGRAGGVGVGVGLAADLHDCPPRGRRSSGRSCASEGAASHFGASRPSDGSIPILSARLHSFRPPLRPAMIIVLKPHATPDQVQQAVSLVNEMGLKEHVITGTERTVIACVGDERYKDPGALASLGFVDSVKPVLAPYKMASRDSKEEASVIPLGGSNGATIGGTTIPVIGGPCSVESEEQTMAAARAVKSAGGVGLRGGAFKPRTNPYSFQGHGEKGLQILAKAREETGLSIFTEVMSIDQVELVCEHADVLQIGARNCQNYNLLAAVGEVRKPVLLKRGMSQTLEEFLLAAEYILARGNEQVILCERGIRTFEDYVRNTLPLAIVPELKRVTHLPVVVDPSHGTGKSALVEPMAMAAIAAGADGIIVEVHHDPAHAMTDGAQSLTPGAFEQMMVKCRRVAQAVDREI